MRRTRCISHSKLRDYTTRLRGGLWLSVVYIIIERGGCINRKERRGREEDRDTNRGESGERGRRMEGIGTCGGACLQGGDGQILLIVNFSRVIWQLMYTTQTPTLRH